MVEPQIVVLVVAGSSPVGHPISAVRDQESDSEFRDLIVDLGRSSLEGVPHWLKIDNVVVSVAQLDRASDFGSEGCGFESLQARKFGRITVCPSLTLRVRIDYESQP